MSKEGGIGNGHLEASEAYQVEAELGLGPEGETHPGTRSGWNISVSCGYGIE